MHFENVIALEQNQQTQSEAQAQAAAQARVEAAQARAEAAQARAEAQAEAQQVREEAQRIREEVQQRIQQEIRENIQGRQGPQGRGQGVIIASPPPPWENTIPPQVVDIVTLFVVGLVICIVGLPIARALGRWIDRRGLPSPVNADLAAQMNRIEQTVDSMSVEVERISEAQRFQAKLLSDRENVRA